MTQDSKLINKKQFTRSEVADILSVALAFIESAGCIEVKLENHKYKRADASDLITKLIFQTKYEILEQKD